MCQQHPQFLTAYRLHMHRTIKPRPHHLRYADPRLSATVAWIACASATSLAFARASALATLAANACACSVSVLFRVPRYLPPRLSPGFEPPPDMVSGYFCCQWLLAGI